MPAILTYRTLFFSAGWLLLSVAHGFGYGAEGHDAVGSIAAERLAGTPTAAKVNELLDGIPLGFAATVPDRIKSWDRSGGSEDDPGGFKMADHPKIEAQLRAFWEANRPTEQNDDAHPSHHWFHYTDVPVEGSEKYADGKEGRSRWDIVHMINYCCRVLSGDEPEQNARAITKPVALILLAHYVGDLHQPLHVGAEYFDNARPANPDTDPHALPDEGGNTLMLSLVGPATDDPDFARKRPRFHSFWDNNAVKLLITQVDAGIKRANPAHPADVPFPEFVHVLAKQEPPNWKPAPTLALKDWAEAWANEILPIAREAHDRLTFTQMQIRTDHGKQVAGGLAMEKGGQHPSYADWAANTVRVEIEKGGYRLALMLDQTLKPAAPAPATVTAAPTPRPAGL